MSPFWMFISISLTLTFHQDRSNFNKPSLGTFPDRFGSSFLRIWTEYHYETMFQRVFWKRFIPPHLILASLQIISKINVGSTNQASDFFLTVLGHYFWKYEPSTTTKQCPKVCFFFKIVHPRLIPTSLQAYLPPDPSNLQMFGMIMAAFLGNLERIECRNNGPNNIC